MNNDINKAIQSIAVNILGMIGDAFGMLRSSRTWIFLITLFVAYVTATQSGLHGIDAWASALSVVVLGGAFIVGKTIRSGAPATTNGNGKTNTGTGTGLPAPALPTPATTLSPVSSAPFTAPVSLPVPQQPIETLGPATKPASTSREEDYPVNLDAFMQIIKDEVDQENANWIKTGAVSGYPMPYITKEQARVMRPLYSSDNPSMVFGRLLGRSEAILIDNNQQALDFTQKLLLPAAMEALTDQLGKILTSGAKCSWPPSPYAGFWVDWCKDHIEGLTEIIKTNFFDFKNYSVWYAGEIAIDWVSKNVPWKTTYLQGVAKNYYYPDTGETSVLVDHA